MARPTGQLLRPKRRKAVRTRRRRFNWSWLRRLPLLWIGAVMICGFLVYFFAGSGIFSVRTVLADSTLSSADVRAIESQCRCIGDNIFMVRSDDIKRRLDQIPTLVVLRVYTRLPNQVIVEARHKQKAAIWRTPDAAYGVDATGEVLQVWKKPFPHFASLHLPVFEDTTKRTRRLLVGEQIDVQPLTLALNLATQLAAVPELQQQVRAYVYTRFVGVTLRSKAGWWALFGMDTDNLDVRVASLRTALETPTTKSLLAQHGCINLLNLKHPYSRSDHNC